MVQLAKHAQDRTHTVVLPATSQPRGPAAFSRAPRPPTVPHHTSTHHTPFMELMKPYTYWKPISASLSPVGRLLLLALIVGLALSGSGSNAQSAAGSQEAIGDAEKLGACVARKVFFPPRGAGAPLGCDYVLKLAAAGSLPGTAASIWISAAVF